ncbi:MAG TPA: hypothetical protein VJV79_03085 [Polyangiaceae bacterium]|nr:hypothetical protein [Polyangiaceae bacterium]
MRLPARLAALVCVLLWLLFGARRAHADSALKLEAVPVLGASSPSVDGWGEVYVRLENSGTAPLSGYVELRVPVAGRGSPPTLSRAPFSIAPKGRVNLLLPSHGLMLRAGETRVVAVDGNGEELRSESLPPQRTLDPLIFDLHTPSRLASVLNSQPVPIRRRNGGYSYGGTTLSVTTPQTNAATGELVLPDLAAGYASATLVLASGRTISSLPPPALDALFSWVLAGGALALVVDRPEDVHSTWLEALAGGHVRSCAAARQLSLVAEFAVPVDSPGKGSFGAAPRVTLESAKPSAELSATFFGLTGANLRVSPWGESASYGLGEVHFLAFNPNTELGANDPWLRLEMLDLVRHAWERASAVALPHGQLSLADFHMDSVRRVLDPNEGTRWTVVVSTLLLLIYAALAGPLNFYLAQRAGRPLRALLHLPIWAGLALASIVLLGVLGKGLTGRARHLTLIEAGAGMARASITRFRGLYGSRADDVTVRASRGSVLDVVGEPDEVTRDLLVDRDGLRLERLREKPWQVQVVREDGFVGLGAGVSLVRAENGELTIKNRCARDLLGVIVKAPGQGLSYFPKLGDGQTVSLREGRSLGPAPASSAFGTRALSASLFHDQVEEKAKGSGAAWAALEALTGADADWWPDDVPILIAELDGGEGRSQDSGLRLDLDRVLLRVVGYGGVP